MENEVGIRVVFWIGTGVMLLAVLTILLIAVLYQSNINKIKTQETQKLLKAALASEQRERERIAQDLHDAVSGDLNALANYVYLLKKRLKEDADKEYVADIHLALQKTLKDIQIISYNLRPPELKTQGFEIALHSFINRLNNYYNKPINLRTHQKLNIKETQQYELFRILQEYLHNVLKYANATSISIELTSIKNTAIVIIQDDGTPFNFHQAAKTSNGLGLLGILSRLSLLHATLHQERKADVTITTIKFNEL